jgi:uncharacterized membrane protein
LTRRLSQWIAVGSLCVLLAILLQPFSVTRALACVPAGAAAVLGLRPPQRWGLGVAILMLPYFSYGVMQALVDAGTRASGILLASASIAAFLAGMDSLRRP